MMTLFHVENVVGILTTQPPSLRPLLHISCFVFADVEFGYPGQPLLFTDLNFGIDMKSRGNRNVPEQFIQLSIVC